MWMDMGLLPWNLQDVIIKKSLDESKIGYEREDRKVL